MITTADFADLFLSSSEFSTLEQFSNGSVICPHSVITDPLLQYGFISPYSFSDTDSGFVITDLGLKYLEYRKNLSLRKIKEERRLRWIEIRSWIAVIISLLALIRNVWINF